jgi:5'-methylthioadenosine phosphorylase
MTDNFRAQIGVIGGSGFYDIPGAEVLDVIEAETPFGKPSSPITLLRSADGFVFAFLARHGRGHVFAPHEVPYRANIFALKAIGIKRLVSVNAVGSLTEKYAPGDLVLPSDLVDRTCGRSGTFFDRGLVAHVGMAEPICRTVRSDLLSARAHTKARLHHGGTLVVIQGPRFSTRAESNTYRGLGYALVGMTTLPEAALAREAEVCYASLSMVTDYDVWHESDEPVSADLIVERLHTTSRAARDLVLGALPALDMRGHCECQDALSDAIVTDPAHIDADVLERLAPIVNRQETR